jgi:hypothetical protein
MQSTAQLVAAEHAKIKRPSDQLFAAFRKDRCAAASRRIGTSRRPRPAATGRAKEARSSQAAARDFGRRSAAATAAR